MEYKEALDKIEKDETKDLSKQEVQQSQELSKEVETFTDKKGNTHKLTEQVAQKWKETLGLRHLDDDYIPQLPQELKKAIGKDLIVKKK